VGSFEQRAHEEGFAGAVIPDGAGSTGPGPGVHVRNNGPGLLCQLEFEELSAIGLGIGVGLVHFTPEAICRILRMLTPS